MLVRSRGIIARPTLRWFSAEPKPKKVYPTDLEIAKNAQMRPIEEIADKLGLREALRPYGTKIGKIKMNEVKLTRDPSQRAKLVLVTAISPTKAGEGKTTCTIGIGDALNKLGVQTTLALREPSLGPCFGMKGGAAGGGYAQVVPMEDLNLHFTGDFHAVGLAHNLLAACIDNHIHQGNRLNIDHRRVTWKRVVDLNDRAMRNIICGLGGVSQGYARESGFEITAASEIMACLCLAKDLADLKHRFGRITIGVTKDKTPVTAADLNVQGAMAALMKNAIHPNIVQTLENNPVIVHGGPFANIAHGCNSVIATELAMNTSDVVITEAGFGADLGAQKFFDIKCRMSGLKPDLTVIVATCRALKLQGGADEKVVLKGPCRQDRALRRGVGNLARHVESVEKYGCPVVVCLNQFAGEDPEEYKIVRRELKEWGLDCPMVESSHWENGGDGAIEMAQCVKDELFSDPNRKNQFQTLYPDDMKLIEKVRKIAQDVYGADDIIADTKLRNKFKRLEKEYKAWNLPICMAKTQYSLSTDPSLMGRPRNFVVPLKDVEVRTGAGFALVLTGDIMTMPGLPVIPAAEAIDVDADGNITGLF